MSPVAPEPSPGSAGTSTLLGLLQQDPRHSQAWMALVDRYSPYISGALRKRGVPQGAAGDCSQEVLLRLVGAIDRDRFDPSHGSFRSYFAQIIANVVNDYERKESQSPAGKGGTDWQEMLANLAGALAEDEQMQTRVLLSPAIEERVKARMENPEEYGVLLDVLLGVSTIDEAAKKLGIKYGTANQKVFRLRQRFRAELEPLLDAGRGEAHGESSEPEQGRPLVEPPGSAVAD